MQSALLWPERARGPPTWRARAALYIYLQYAHGHGYPGDGDEVALDPLLAGAEAASVIDDQARVPGLQGWEGGGVD